MMQSNIKTQWMSVVVTVFMIVPLAILIADICACHSTPDATDCHHPECCNIPDTHTAHNDCCCIECAGDTDYSMLPVTAVPANPDRNKTDINCQLYLAVTVSHPVPVFTDLDSFSYPESTGPPAPIHLKSTILLI
jgi:hypothetical protein